MPESDRRMDGTLGPSPFSRSVVEVTRS
jgi:hypothetical protein